MSCALTIAQPQDTPRDFASNHALGERYVQQHNYTAAERYLGAAYKLNPADEDNAFDLAQAELQTGDAATARNLLQTLLAHHDRPDFHNLLGDCEEALGDFHEAANQYQIAARADPSEPNLFSFGSELLKHGAYREALQIISYAVEHYPQSARLQVALGIAQYSVGQYREAVATLCSAVDRNPSDPRPFEFLGKMIGIAPELSSEVSARLRQFAAAYPNNASANYYYAVSLLAVPNASRDLPRRLLERAIAESPFFADAHYQLGLLYEEQGDTTHAIAQLETAIHLKPDWKSAHYHLAQLYRKAGKTQLAEREFEAVRTAPAR
ncbi:MAG TPA: tetratricopeptide repeat protein [Bryobacteraceae bacterium]|nr:tetratricopeptide repeat protein [Bryobacteraceae bacterium]